MNLMLIGIMTNNNILNFGNIHDTYVAFEEDPSNGKTRPVLIIKEKSSNLYAVMLITGTPPKKGHEFQEKTRYEILDWQACGLDKKSYVKSYPRDMRNIPESNLAKHRGCFTPRDNQQFKQHIKELQQYLADNPHLK